MQIWQVHESTDYSNDRKIVTPFFKDISALKISIENPDFFLELKHCLQLKEYATLSATKHLIDIPSYCRFYKHTNVPMQGWRRICFEGSACLKHENNIQNVFFMCTPTVHTQGKHNILCPEQPSLIDTCKDIPPHTHTYRQIGTSNLFS